MDDTTTKQSSVKSANEFLSTLNNCYPSLQFTMEIEVEGKLPFLGAELIKNDDRLETKVYIKPTNTGLLLHFDSNVDMNYKKALVVTTLNRAYRLSSTWKYFTEECERLREVIYQQETSNHNRKCPCKSGRKRRCVAIASSIQEPEIS